LGSSFANAGQRIASAGCSPVVMRIVPAGFSRKLGIHEDQVSLVRVAGLR
jgi:hypothetical protein